MRKSHAFVVLIAGVLAVAAPARVLGQHVPPDPKVVAVLQAIQTAYDHKDAARYSELLGKDLVGVAYDEKGEQVPLFQTLRDDIIKNFLTQGQADSQALSPFIDATPISKRILYADNIAGGQRVRVLLLNRPVPKAAQTVSWVMDLSVTHQGGAAGPLMLSELSILPADLAKQVFWPMLQELGKRNLPEAQAQAEAVALYNQDRAKFAATMPKPELMPVGPTGTPMPPSPPSNLTVKRPSAVLPPPPPRIQIPTRPTAFDPLPKPEAPKFLPPAQVTDRVRKLRTQIQDTVQKNFVDFVGRPLAEQYVQYGGRRYYVNVYQNRVRANYGAITVVITINLVFVQPPRGSMTVYMAPTMDSDPPQQPIQPPVLPQTPIALPPPAASAAGCMVLTDTAKLKAKHGPRFDEISRYLSSFGPILDLAGANIRPGDFAAVDAFVKKNFDRAKCDCLFIFGNHDVVPFATYPNPTASVAGDPDPTVWSDDVYGDFDHDAQADPEIMVVRMPDDPGILADPNSVLYRSSATSQRITLSDYAVYGNMHRSSPPLLAQFANPGKPELLERSTPLTADNFSDSFFKGHNAVINLHGGDGADIAGSYWGEQPDNKQVVAMTADQAVAPDGVVLCCACYGGSTANVQSDGSILPKSSDSHIGLRFLRNGASAFVGYTRVTWQAISADALNQGEGMASKRFIELTRQGQSPQKAFQLVKREMAQVMDRRDPQFKKMYREMIYLGLPPTGQRQVAPVATPDRPATVKTQLVRVLEQAQQAAQQNNVDKLAAVLTATIRDGIQDGPDVDARAMAQRIIDLKNQPEAANPLADKAKIDEQLFLVEREKAPNDEFIASLRVPVEQKALDNSSTPNEPVDSVVRLKFRKDGDQIKISGWETQNKDFVQKVVQPQEKWVQENKVTDPEEAKEKYQDRVEAYIDDAVAKAAQSNTDATYAPNPLAVTATAPAGEMPAWMIALLIAAGAVVVLVPVVAVALRSRGNQGQPQGQPQQASGAAAVVVGCPQCGRQHAIAAGYAGMAIRCPCGAVLQTPGAPGVGVAAMPLAPPAVGVAVMAPTVLRVAPGQLAPGIAPRPERGGRGLRIVFFGLLLLASFFIPDLVPGLTEGVTARFSNIVLLGDANVPALWKFLIAFPAAAAVLAILLAVVTDWRWRGVVLAALPWVPAIVLATQKEGDFLGATLGDVMMTTVKSFTHSPWVMIVGLLGVLALWIGSRARWYRPAYGWLYLLTFAGAAGFAVWQAVPVGEGGAQNLPAAALIQALREGTGQTTGQKVMVGAMLGSLGLVALAGLLALVNVPGRRASIRGVAGAAFWLVVLAVAVMLGCTLAPEFQAIGQFKGWAVASMVLALLKQWLLLVGMWLLFLGGLVDVIIGPAPRRPRPA